LTQQSNWHVWNSVYFFEEKRYSDGGGGGRGSTLLSFLIKICPIHHALTIRYLFKIKHRYFSLQIFCIQY